MKINEIAALPKTAWDQEDVDYEARDIRKKVSQKKVSKDRFGHHKLVPVTGLPDGFYLTYQKELDAEWEVGTGAVKRDKFIVALIDARESMTNPKIVSYMWFNPENVYFGEPNYSSISGLKVRLLGTTSEYKGHGYALQVYKMLVNHGQILFSDTSQTPDGTNIWKKLITSGEFSAWALTIEKSSTLGLVKALGPIDMSNSYDAMKEVFGGEANQFVLVPKNDKQTIDLLKTKRPNWFKASE